MLNTFKKLAAQLLIVVFVVGSLTLTSAEAASLGVPGNPRFHRWRNTDYTSCYIRWDPVAGADYYEYYYCWTDGSHKVTSTDCNIHSKYVEAKISGLNGRHVYQLCIRACKKDGTHGWYSTPAFITPWPKGVKGKLTSSSGTNVKLSWKTVYGCSGYNVFLATNPSGTWRYNQSTSTKATSTSATVKKYRGSKLKKYQNYYVRVITRRHRNGQFCTVPEPSKKYYQYKFYIYDVY
jgi:hypothetical protein